MKSFFSAGLLGKPLLLLVLLCCGWPQLIKAQVSWSVTATADPSTCASNGQIHAHILNFDTVPLDSIRFLLYENDTLRRSSNPDSNFNALRPGTYKVVVNAYRGTTAVSAFVDGIVVTKNYQEPTVAVSQFLVSLKYCNTGIAELVAYGSRDPFMITMTNYPSTYTDTARHFTSGNGDHLQLYNLAYGEYKFSVKDQCGTSTSPVLVKIDTLPPFNQWVTDNTISTYYGTNADCKSVVVSSRIYYDNYNPDFNYYLDQCQFSVRYNGDIISPHQQINSGNDITFSLSSIYANYKQAIGQTFEIMIFPPCGGTPIALHKQIGATDLAYYVQKRYCNSFDVNIYTTKNNPTCYPVYAKVIMNGVIKYDTLYSYKTQSILHNLPYGKGRVTLRANDGQIISDTLEIENKFSIQGMIFINSYSYWGNDSTAQILLERSDYGVFPDSFRIKIGQTPINTVRNGYNSRNFLTPPLYPGIYTIYYEDSCHKDTLTIPITNADVIHYQWNIDSLHIKKVCGGVSIRPTGSYIANGVTYSNPYFRITSYPGMIGPVVDEYFADNTLSPNNEKILTLPGTYTIAIAADTWVGDYSRGRGNGRNVLTFTVTNEGAALDPVNSLGYVCPGLNDSLGSIYAVGWKGIPPYKYQLYNGTALLATKQGAGQTTSTSQLGVFFNSSTFPLIKNHTYTIKVTDSCGSSGQSDVKIIDLATAKLISSAYPTYCIGQDISMKIQNLPKTTSDVTTYLWTGPLGFSNTLQNPVIKNCKVANGGTYKVTVSTDLCNQPIHDSIVIPVKDWVPVCYSTITDTLLNPFATGLTGNYRASRAFTYYASRAESDLATPINLRTNGTFASFSPYWKFVNGKLLNSQADTTKWVWNSSQTMYNVKGLELENKDALGRYNCGLYGYSATLPIAVVQNSQFKESGFDGFEDYSYETAGCGGPCNSDRHWDFTVSPAFKLDTVESHTGKYSLALGKFDTLSMATKLSTNGFADPELSVVQKSNCNGSLGLRGIYADQKALIPNLSLLKGKDYWLSAWVKESGNCKCESYLANKIVVHINYDGGSHADMEYHATGRIIEGWQRYEIPISLADSAISFSVSLVPTGTANVYFDDIRIHPFNANMKSFVYNPENLRLMSELDENNYATFYEYDNDGTLVRVKKETAKGVMTIKETRTSLQKGE